MKPIHCLACLLCLLLVGCSPWVGGYYYVPHPGLVNVPATQPSQPPAVAVFASVVGVRYPDDQQHIPYTVEVRLRLENNGPDTISFDARSLDLTTGDLVRFPPALPISPPELTLQPGQSAVINADFPFPAGKSYDDFDLSSLHLRWTVRMAARDVQLAIDFQRGGYRYYSSDPYYYDGPYWGAYPYPYPYVGGVVVIHHR